MYVYVCVCAYWSIMVLFFLCVALRQPTAERPTHVCMNSLYVCMHVCNSTSSALLLLASILNNTSVSWLRMHACIYACMYVCMYVCSVCMYV